MNRSLKAIAAWAATSPLAAFSPAGEAAADGWTSKTYFEDLFKYWYPPSANIEKKALQHAEIYSQIMERLRTQAELRSLDYDLFGKFIGEPSALSKEHERDSFYIVNSLIQLMENVYADLDLEHEWDHPHVEGWKNIFQRWADHQAFPRRGWSSSRPTAADSTVFITGGF